MNIKRELRTWGPFLVLPLFLVGLADYQRPSVRQARLDAKLVAAVHSHDARSAIEALNAGANPNVRDYYRPLPTLLIRLRHPDAAREDDQVHAQEWVPVLASAVIFDSEGEPSNNNIINNNIIVQSLLSHGADVNGRDYAGDRVLGAAAYQGRLDWVQTFLNRGADAGSKADALSSAVMANRPGIMRLLIARGADINARERFGSTPLTESCEIHQAALTRLLLSYGADPSWPGSDGKTALQIALGWRHPNPMLIQTLKHYQETYKRP